MHLILTYFTAMPPQLSLLSPYTSVNRILKFYDLIVRKLFEIGRGLRRLQFFKTSGVKLIHQSPVSVL